MTNKKKKYRLNVAAIIKNDESRILIAERSDVPDAWQFPQGGIDKGESNEEALIREIEEELGLSPSKYEILKERGGYRYDFAGERLRDGVYSGQEQTYFLCRFHGEDEDVDLSSHQKVEFSNWQWIKPEDFKLKWAPDFKRNVFKKVFSDFFDVELV